jgi:hypothetical protein
MPLPGKNFLDAVTPVSYNTSLHMPTRTWGTSVTEICSNEHVPAASPEMIKRLASIVAEEPKTQL